MKLLDSQRALSAAALVHAASQHCNQLVILAMHFSIARTHTYHLVMHDVTREVDTILIANQGGQNGRPQALTWEVTCLHGESLPRRGLPCTQRMCHRPHQSLYASAACLPLLWRPVQSAPAEARTGLAERWEARPQPQRKLCQQFPQAAAARWTSRSAILRGSLHRSLAADIISKACSAEWHMSRFDCSMGALSQSHKLSASHCMLCLPVRIVITSVTPSEAGADT